MKSLFAQIQKTLPKELQSKNRENQEIVGYISGDTRLRAQAASSKMLRFEDVTSPGPNLDCKNCYVLETS